MTAEQVISIISTIAALVFGYIALQRNRKKDTIDATQDLMTIKLDLKYTRDTLDRVDRRMSDFETRLSQNHDELASLRKDCDLVMKRLDALERKEEKK